MLISPAEALEIGLVDELAPTERVVEQAVRWCQTLLALPADAMAATRLEARADLVAIFQRDLDRELEKVIAAWWSPETQGTLRTLAEKLEKKA